LNARSSLAVTAGAVDLDPEAQPGSATALPEICPHLRRIGRVGSGERCVEEVLGQRFCVGGTAGIVEVTLQPCCSALVRISPSAGLIRFDRWVSRSKPPPMIPSNAWGPV